MKFFEEYEILQGIEKKLLEEIQSLPKRDIFFSIPWEQDNIILWWERGVGKTTLLLQKRGETDKSFYFSADNVIIQQAGLFKFVFFLYEEIGIKNFFIDEIFKYSNWTVELKNIIDSLPGSKVYASGSSALELYRWIADLGRRTTDIQVKGFSFREFLNFKYWYKLPILSLEDILTNHQQLSTLIASEIDWLFSKWKEYIRQGVYPFGVFLDEDSFFLKLQKTLERIIVWDLPSIKNFDTLTIRSLQKLFYFLSHIPPSEISISSLADKIGINKVTLSQVLDLLDKIWVIFLVPKYGSLTDKLRKQYKIFLSNPNKYFAYNRRPSEWTLRESAFLFFVSFIRWAEVFAGKGSDFWLQVGEKTFKFEIWWKSKAGKKAKYQGWTYLVIDDIKVSNEKNVIPLWIFGFLG